MTTLYREGERARKRRDPKAPPRLNCVRLGLGPLDREPLCVLLALLLYPADQVVPARRRLGTGFALRLVLVASPDPLVSTRLSALRRLQDQPEYRLLGFAQGAVELLQLPDERLDLRATGLYLLILRHCFSPLCSFSLPRLYEHQCRVLHVALLSST